MTKIINQKTEINDELLVASNALKEGKLVIFPTETVYGLGADATNEEAVKNIFIAKGRASDNPLIVHISSKEQINEVVTQINDIEQKLINKFMPGPFTLILPKKNNICETVSASLDTIGVRIPDSDIARQLIKFSGRPIAAPSANISGRPSGTRVEDIFDEFNGRVDYIVDGGESNVGIESTVVRVINNVPVILRPGKVTKEEIVEVVGICKIDDNIFKKAEGVVLSPGMKYKHYAPNAKCLLIYSDDINKLIKTVNDNVSTNTTVIGFNELEDNIKCNKYYKLGSINNLDEISHNIFKLLRVTDKENPDLIIIMGVPKKGLGLALMNRLLRSCSYNYIEI